MRVLITGASGFIGGRLVDAAIARWGRDSVVAFSSKNITQCHSIIYGEYGFGFELSHSDVELIESVNVIIHAGAYTPKNSGMANAVKLNNQNVNFTDSLLSLPFKSLEKIIFTSTLDVYASVTPISESSPVEPLTLYGWSKLYCERVIEHYASQNNFMSHILRIGHVYGPGEEQYEKFLPKTIKRIIDGESVELYGDGADLRSFIYIDDVVSSVLAAVDLKADVGVINIVGGNALSIKDVLEKIIDISGRTVEVINKEAGGTGRDFVFDTAKIKKYLLAEEVDFDFGLRSEFAYFEAGK